MRDNAPGDEAMRAGREAAAQRRRHAALVACVLAAGVALRQTVAGVAVLVQECLTLVRARCVVVFGS